MSNLPTALLQKTGDFCPQKAQQYSPLVLAYIGDGVYEMFIRTYVIKKGNAPVNKFHRAAKDLVKAQTQRKLYHVLEPHLTELEREVLKRGRNAKSVSSAKNAAITDYRHATGVEALIGYLYLDGQIERIDELMKLGLSYIEEETEGKE